MAMANMVGPSFVEKKVPFCLIVHVLRDLTLVVHNTEMGKVTEWESKWEARNGKTIMAKK